MTYTITLSFPPSNNNLHVNGANKQRYKTKKYTKWLANSDLLALTQKPFPRFTKRVDVVCYLNGGANNYDSDNFLKAAMDYIVKLGIIKDDSKLYVRSTKAIWEDDSSQMTITIEIKEI